MKGGKPDKTTLIWKLKNLVLTKGPIVYRQLCFVVDCFTRLNETLRKLETPRSLSEAISIVQEMIDYIYDAAKLFENDDSHLEEKIKCIDIYKKLIMVLSNNKDLPIAFQRSKEDKVYENLPTTSAPIEDWFSMFRSTLSEYRPYSQELTSHMVFCKSNITRYILTSQSKDKVR